MSEAFTRCTSLDVLVFTKRLLSGGQIHENGWLNCENSRPN
jgi:hypothetical protein